MDMSPFAKALKDRRDHYCREQHYMRGPGPKWREKHGIKEPMPPAPRKVVHTRPSRFYTSISSFLTKAFGRLKLPSNRFPKVARR